jgi:hypothetical protein
MAFSAQQISSSTILNHEICPRVENAAMRARIACWKLPLAVILIVPMCVNRRLIGHRSTSKGDPILHQLTH